MVVVNGNFELAVEPPLIVLPFSGAQGKLAEVQLSLTNKAEYPLAYKVKVSDNKVIKIENAAGLLPVGQSANVVLKSGPLTDPPSAQNVSIYNIPAEGGDIKSAFSANPQGSGNIMLDTSFD